MTQPMKKIFGVKGMTVIETTVVIGILSVTTMVVTLMYLAQGRIFGGQQARAGLRSDAAVFEDWFQNYVGVAKRVVTSRVVNGVLYTSASGTVVLELPSLDASGRAVSGADDYVAFFRDPADPAKLRVSLEAHVVSSRQSLERTLLAHVRTAGFRYDASTPAGADAVSYGVVLASQDRDLTHILNIHGTSTLNN